jgi:hypothetical protein
MFCVGRKVAPFFLLAAGCVEPTGRGHQAWAPTVGAAEEEGDDDGESDLDIEPIDESSTFVGDEEGGNEGFDCVGDDAQECECIGDPGSIGVQFCEDGLWGKCMCQVDPTAGGGSTGSVETGDEGSEVEGGEEETGEPAPTEVCFPGADDSYTTCFELTYFDPDAPPAGYEYPAALGGDANYRRPIAFIDLDSIDGTTAVAPNFLLQELAQAFKGRWAIVQPHAVESLQELRDLGGPLNVNSGYRSPAYNAEVGGAGYSRHMYGDGFDVDPVSVTIDELEALCVGGGGMLVEYETHVHCDWRDHAVAVEFFGPPDAAAPHEPELVATVEHDGTRLVTSVAGFDEGEPVRRWTARDAEGRVIVVAAGRSFVPPRGTARVEVVVGRVVHASWVP